MEFSVKPFSMKKLPPSLYEELGTMCTICSLQSMANLYTEIFKLQAFQALHYQTSQAKSRLDFEVQAVQASNS